MKTARVSLFSTALVLLFGVAAPVPALHVPADPLTDQGLTDPGEEQVFARALQLLLAEEQAGNVDTIFTVRDQAAPREGCPLTGLVYWAYARRGTICFSRQPAGEGWSFGVHVLRGVNPMAAQGHTALATLAEERAASSQSEGEGDDFRNLIDDSSVAYPFAYERIVAAFDSPRAGDFIVMPHHLADKGDQKGAHGHLGVTQSRSTLLVSGRGARRSPLTPEAEAALGIQHVDIAPTVASALGVRPYSLDRPGEVARGLNGEPAPGALLERQDGEVLEELLEPVFNTIVVVIDGLHPADVPLMTSLTGLINETCSAPGCTHATVYEQARGVLSAETGPNHASMMTGAYAEVHGITGDAYIEDRSTGEQVDLEGRPDLMGARTLFDQIETQAPWLRTAAVMGKTVLREMFDCTRNPQGACTGLVSTDPNNFSHLGPDILVGASTSPSDPERDCPAEPGTGTGYAHDPCVMDLALGVLAREDPDFTLINLPDIDGFSHLHGRGTPLQLAAVAAADLQIRRLVDYLKASGKWQHSSVIVTADHNFGDTALPTTRIFLEDGIFAGVDQDAFEVITSGGFASVFLTGTVDPNNPTAAQQQTLKQLRDLAVATPGIAEALYRLPNPADGGAAHTVGTVHPAWRLNTPRAGELMLTAAETHTMFASTTDSANVLLGEHGRPTDRHVPFIVLSGGTYVRDGAVTPSGAVNETDDTGALPEQAELVDIAPTIAWILGVDAPPSSQGRILNGPGDAFLESPARAQADGDITEPIANRAAILIYDQNNSVMVNCLVRPSTCQGQMLPSNVPDDPRTYVPTLVDLADGGTLMRYGSIASFPSVTFPNHNVVGSGTHPGHHGIVNNRFYIRETGVTETPIDPTSPQHPLFHFSVGLMSQEVETLHEAVHRTFGDWKPADGPSSTKAFTASVNEPSARGADFATLEPTDTEDGTAQDGDSHPSFPNPQTYGPTANPADQLQDVTQGCAQRSPTHYFQESTLDWLGQTQARRLFDSNSLYGHPLPKYLINNFPLTDGAGHEFGPHTDCTFAAYRDADRRLARILGAIEDAGVLGETLIVVTGDHGGENVQEGREGLPSQLSRVIDDDDDQDQNDSEDIQHVMTDWQVYLRTMDVEMAKVDIVPGQGVSTTFAVTDDDRAAGGSTRPVAGATVRLEDVEGGSVTGTTDASGNVTLAFTPRTDRITAVVTSALAGPPPTDLDGGVPQASFSERVAQFTSEGLVDQGTPAPPGVGGGAGGLCPGLENILGLHIVGDQGGNHLTGTEGRDVLCGGGGNDVIAGLGGPDFMVGGEGDDAVAPGEGDDEAFGNDGVDLLDYAGLRTGVRVDLGASLSSGAGRDTIGGFQSARGGAARDILIGDVTANRLIGGKGSDTLSGLAGRDRLSGGPGRDRLKGGPGKDRLRGGPGPDRCAGGPGKDRVSRCGRRR